MSYQRGFHHNADPVIVFYYLREDLFSVVNLYTLYRSKNIIQSQGAEAGKSMIDEYALTEDERDAFYLFAKNALYNVFGEVYKMTKALSDTVFINDGVYTGESSTSDVVTGDPAYGFMIYDNDAYNDNVLQLVDNEVLNHIKYEILYNWFELAGIDPEAAKYRAKLTESRINLVNKYLFQLRKPLIS